MQQHIFPFESELQNTSKTSSSHCSSIQERLANYGSEALDSSEHLGLIIGNQTKAAAFDPNRAAVIICGGDKSGGSEDLFYRQMIAKADARFNAHLAQIEAEKEAQKKVQKETQNRRKKKR